MKWLEEILAPKEAQFREISLEQIQSALRNQSVQNRWLNSLIDKLQKINLELDRLLNKSDRLKLEIWTKLAIERRTILRCITMILDAQDELESEQFTQENQNRLMEKFRGTAVPLRQS